MTRAPAPQSRSSNIRAASARPRRRRTARTRRGPAQGRRDRSFGPLSEAVGRGALDRAEPDQGARGDSGSEHKGVVRARAHPSHRCETIFAARPLAQAKGLTDPRGGRKSRKPRPGGRGFRRSRRHQGSDTHMTPGHLSARALLRRGLESPRKFPAHLGLTNETLDHLLSMRCRDTQCRRALSRVKRRKGDSLSQCELRSNSKRL